MKVYVATLTLWLHPDDDRITSTIELGVFSDVIQAHRACVVHAQHQQVGLLPWSEDEDTLRIGDTAWYAWVPRGRVAALTEDDVEDPDENVGMYEVYEALLDHQWRDGAHTVDFRMVSP